MSSGYGVATERWTSLFGRCAATSGCGARRARPTWLVYAFFAPCLARCIAAKACLSALVSRYEGCPSTALVVMRFGAPFTAAGLLCWLIGCLACVCDVVTRFDRSTPLKLQRAQRQGEWASRAPCAARIRGRPLAAISPSAATPRIHRDTSVESGDGPLWIVPRGSDGRATSRSLDKVPTGRLHWSRNIIENYRLHLVLRVVGGLPPGPEDALLDLGELQPRIFLAHLGRLALGELVEEHLEVF